MQRIVKTSISLVALYLIGGTALDRFVFPESAPDESYYPPVGYVFASESEGFEQRILKREEGLFWLELTLHSDAPGPPEHIHTSFSERFMVAEGTLSLLVNGEVMELGPSESFLVEPGTPHKPFNQTNQLVVVRGPLTEEYGIPEPFSVFLIQASSLPRRCFRCLVSALFTIRGWPIPRWQCSAFCSMPSGRRRDFWGIGRTIRASNRVVWPNR